MWRLLVVSLSLAFPPDGASAPRFSGDAGTPEYGRAKALIEQLGDERFARREEATKALQEMGAAAAAALRESLAAPDDEVRRRCQQLLPQAAAADWRRRADAFEADAEGRQSHRLPLYERFVQLAGKDAAARKLFAAMLRSNGELLAEAARGVKTGEAYHHECDRLLHELAEKETPSQASGRLAILLLISSGLRDEKVDFQASKGVSYLVASPLVSDSLKSEATGPAFRRLLLAWAETRNLADRGTAVHLLFGIQKHRLKEALPLAEKIAKDRAAPPWARAFAIEVLAELGGKESLAALEKLLHEEAATTIGGGQEEGRVGDHALGQAITIQGARHGDYGLRRATEPMSVLGPLGVQRTIAFFYFDTPRQREEALKRWEKEMKGPGR
jgi:hypothetical protein